MLTRLLKRLASYPTRNLTAKRNKIGPGAGAWSGPSWTTLGCRPRRGIQGAPSGASVRAAAACRVGPVRRGRWKRALGA